MFADLESEVLATSLSSLETLILSYWDISQGRLIPILRKTAETLKNLVLKHVQGLDHICGSGVPDLVDDNHANAKTGKLELENLRRLAVECEWADNKALLEFITDCCPRLERLDLGETLLENEEMVDQLEQRLKQIRPGLGRDLSDAQRRRMGARFITRDV
ncbi:hypothetical protein BGX28_008322 [Mortierella sp. GBA30]|nr:hypothetical protein BGX28_008322 [Mortierella sp. GBA30]